MGYFIIKIKDIVLSNKKIHTIIILKKYIMKHIMVLIFFLFPLPFFFSLNESKLKLAEFSSTYKMTKFSICFISFQFYLFCLALETFLDSS